MSETSRRNFLKASLLGAGGLSLGLIAFTRHGGAGNLTSVREAMGPLAVVNDETTGLPLIKLPEGFRYKTLSWAGSRLHDGYEVPGFADGMGVVREEDSLVTLVRNHELEGTTGPIGDPAKAYDVMPGGTTTLVFDTQKEELIDSKVSLGGTVYNCAGGVTPWGTWLSCEEATFNPEMARRPFGANPDEWKKNAPRQPHGFVFEVPPDGVVKPEPILDMGQFLHEAVVIDPLTGMAYLTEDNQPNAGFYRFIPNVSGQLAHGGRLQMMKVIDRPQMKDRLVLGEQLDVEWVDIPDPTAGLLPEYPNSDGVARQGIAAGASAFISLEGCAISEGRIYFTSKRGGKANTGCVFEYHPSLEKIWLVFESPGQDYFSGPDNLVVSPRGSLVICEDSLSYGTKAQSIGGLTREGEFFRFCQVNPDLRGSYGGHNLAKTALTSEWAGASFSGNGDWMFINIQNPGFTLAITGPWQDGYI